MNTLRKALLDEESFATTLLLIFIDAYGTEALHWDPETIQLELQDDFNVKLPNTNRDKLLAAINLVVEDSFYTSLPDFVTFCNVLSGDTYNPSMWDRADVAECCWGILEGMLLNPPEKKEDIFSGEILAYIEASMDSEGILNPPSVLADIGISANADPLLEFSDDPLMTSAITEVESGKTNHINEQMRKRVGLMIDQLNPLELKHGNTADALTKTLQEAI